MSFNTTWDVDKYFDKTEPELHWELQKKFMNAHKMKFPENRLVCYAKMFGNIEFMGCRYNTEVMTLVENLAKQVPSIIDYREQKKFKLQRTFVKASDAVKRNVPIENKMERNNETNQQLNANKEPLWMTKRKEEQRLEANTKRFKPNDQVNIIQKNDLNINFENKKLLERIRRQGGYKSKLIIFEREHLTENPFQILYNSSEKCKLNLKLERINNHFMLKINNETVVEGTASSEKAAKETLGAEALVKLKEYCFTVLVKSPLQGQSIDKEETNEKPDDKTEQSSFPADNVGAKIMKLMGWSGQGLGKKEDGRKDAIVAEQRIDRLGLGLGVGQADLRKKIEECLKNYIKNNESSNLVFSSEFTIQERAQIHSIAQKFNLKSTSYGKNQDRRLVVQRKQTAWQIVEELLAQKGSPNYSLIKPTKV